MSQGDATADATHDIATLVREITFARDENEVDALMRAIRKIRLRADTIEKHQPWNAATSDALNQIMATINAEVNAPRPGDKLGLRVPMEVGRSLARPLYELHDLFEQQRRAAARQDEARTP